MKRKKPQQKNTFFKHIFNVTLLEKRTQRAHLYIKNNNFKVESLVKVGKI